MTCVKKNRFFFFLRMFPTQRVISHIVTNKNTDFSNITCTCVRTYVNIHVYTHIYIIDKLSSDLISTFSR